LDKAIGRVQFGCQRNFFDSIISKLDKHVVLLLINYITCEEIQLRKENLRYITYVTYVTLEFPLVENVQPRFCALGGVRVFVSASKSINFLFLQPWKSLICVRTAKNEKIGQIFFTVQIPPCCQQQWRPVRLSVLAFAHC